MVLNKAAAVKEFSVFESAGPKFKKAVVILSGPVIGSTKTTTDVVLAYRTVAQKLLDSIAFAHHLGLREALHVSQHSRCAVRSGWDLD